MRLATLVLLLALATAGHAQQFYTTTFQNQDFHAKEWKAVERYGKSESEIVAMGHDRFVAWYCDAARAGKEARARIEAEKVYSLALNECSAPLLLRLSRPEQKFMEETMSALADMAKSSVGCAILSYGDDKSWGMHYARSATAVTETVYALLNPRVPLSGDSTSDLEGTYSFLSQRIEARHAEQKDAGGRLKFLDGHIQNIFKDRTPREKTLARAFVIRSVQFAVTDPSQFLGFRD